MASFLLLTRMSDYAALIEPMALEGQQMILRMQMTR